MDWHSLAVKNIRHTIRRYMSYLLASTMAVAVFNMFFLFLFNPTAQTLTGSKKVNIVMVLCIIAVALFALFFIFYFHASLMRVRNKEFGLLMTLGMTPRQVGRLIFYESICIGLTALVLGLLLGMLCLQPFQLAIGAILILQNSIPFIVEPQALLTTAGFFGAIFLMDALVVSVRVTRRTPRVLLLGARIQQTPPRTSWLLMGLGLLCLGIAYDQAAQFSQLFLLNAIPIVVLTIIGTFLLFSQTMVMLLNWLRRRSLRGTSLLIVSRLSYRMKDYARMLAIVTVLNAMVLTGIGTVYSFLQGVQAGVAQANPFSLQLVEQQTHSSTTPFTQMVAVLQHKQLDVQQQVTVPQLSGKVGSIPVTVLSLSDFKRVRTALLQVHPNLAASTLAVSQLTTQQAYLDTPVDNLNNASSTTPLALPADHMLKLQVGKTTYMFQASEGTQRLINASGEVSSTVLVVNDQVYADIQKTVPAAQMAYLDIFQFPNLQQTVAAITVLQKLPGNADNVDLMIALSDISALQFISVLLFAGFLVSLLFLFAAASALYFKLFAQQEEDQRQFRALARIGLQRREALRILSIEFLLLFFLPVGVAVLHSSFATLDLIFLSGANSALAKVIWSAVGITCLIYATFFAVYYLVALLNYYKRMPVAIV